jgi:hypothetical protein
VCSAGKCDPYKIYVLTGRNMHNGTFSSRGDAIDGLEWWAEASGYVVTWVSGATPSDLADATSDPMAVGVIADFHGNSKRLSTGDWPEDKIYPSGVSPASSSLKFVVMIACEAGQSAQAFANAWGTSVYGYTESVIWDDVVENNIIEKAFLDHLDLVGR